MKKAFTLCIVAAGLYAASGFLFPATVPGPSHYIAAAICLAGAFAAFTHEENARAIAERRAWGHAQARERHERRQIELNREIDNLLRERRAKATR
jgi:hypothetical protein